MNKNSTVQEMRKGLLVLAVLHTLKNKKLYAADILSALQNTEFTTQEGTLYPLLSRLKREGLIDHEWVESSSGPPRKYYVLNTLGRARAKELMTYMNTMRNDLKKLGEDKKDNE